MAKNISFTADFSELAAYTGFVKSWQKNLEKIHFPEVVKSPEIAEALNEIVKDELNYRLMNSRFGEFMAERTVVRVIPAAGGYQIQVGGLTEKEAKAAGVTSSKFKEGGNDWNLWEKFEFGSEVPELLKELRASGMSKKAVIKDTGGAVAIRGDSGETNLKDTRVGLVSGILDQMLPKLQMHLNRLVASRLEYIVWEAASRATSGGGVFGFDNDNIPSLEKGKRSKKVTKVRGLSNAIRQELKKSEGIYERDLLAAGVVRAGISTQGQRYFKDARGRFTSIAGAGRSERIRP